MRQLIAVVSCLLLAVPVKAEFDLRPYILGSVSAACYFKAYQETKISMAYREEEEMLRLNAEAAHTWYDRDYWSGKSTQAGNMKNASKRVKNSLVVVGTLALVLNFAVIKHKFIQVKLRPVQRSFDICMKF